MGKDGGFLTPKAIGNRIKAKGLQKLRWYCQMCQKQCRDENGFKARAPPPPASQSRPHTLASHACCSHLPLRRRGRAQCHCMSESHQRQMAMFSENSGAYMDEFSREFEEGMMEIIKRKAKSQRCAANQIYKEFISFKQHFHMNATVWETLTDFVMYLGREGKCEVDETEKGWFLTYIDRDPEKLRQLEQRAKRERTEMDSEEKYLRDVERINKMARAAAAAGDEDDAPHATELLREEGAPAVAFSGIAAKPKLKEPPKAACAFFGGASSSSSGGGGVVASTDDAGASSSGGGTSTSAAGAGAGASSSTSTSGSKAKMSGMQQLMQQEEKRKEGAARTDYWLATGVIVKVMNKSLSDGDYYKQKGTVEKLLDRYTGHVRMHHNGKLLKLDQDELETVIPQVGGRVLVVNGTYRGAEAKLVAINVEQFSTSLQVLSGMHAGRTIEGVEYEDVCKLAPKEE